MCEPASLETTDAPASGSAVHPFARGSPIAGMTMVDRMYESSGAGAITEQLALPPGEGQAASG